MVCSIPRKEVAMKSRESHDRLDALLTEYAIEHLDWPDSEEELDRFLTS